MLRCLVPSGGSAAASSPRATHVWGRPLRAVATLGGGGRNAGAVSPARRGRLVPQGHNPTRAEARAG